MYQMVQKVCWFENCNKVNEWLKVNEADPGFQLLTSEEIVESLKIHHHPDLIFINILFPDRPPFLTIFQQILTDSSCN